MAIWDRFRRKQEQSVLPDEVNKYYQPESQGNRAMAFLLGLVTLVITLAIVALLFFGGRAIYRHYSKKSTPTVTHPASVNQNGQTDNSSNGDNNSSPSDSSSNNSSSNGSSSNGSATSPSGSGTTGSSPMPATGDEQPSLPATGSPEGM